MEDSQNSFIDRASSSPFPFSKWDVAKLHARTKLVDVLEKFSLPPAKKSFGDQPFVLVGPVIGLVSPTSARILIEISQDSHVEISLQAQPSPSPLPQQELRFSASFLRRGTSQTSQRLSHQIPPDPIAQTKLIPAKRATVFEFKNLLPGTRYVVRVKGCHDAAEHSSFRTFPAEPAKAFRFGAVSCNSIFITRRTITGISDLWAHLLTKMQGPEPLELLVHLGDQIYGDGDRNLDAGAGKDRNKWSNRFKVAKAMLENVPADQWILKQDDICEKYREVYRETWKHPDTAKCLARCPNLMIYDDHEIRDNWGDNSSDRDAGSVDFFVARCAWIVTLEYQRQLHEDVDFSNLGAIKKDYHFHVIGKVGFMFLDIRGSRTFHRVKDDKKPYLGSKQWEDIKQAMGDDGIFHKVQVLVVCSPAPLVFLVPSITNVAGKTVHRLEDFKGHWSAHKKEQVEMIECLQQWKVSGKGRQVLVLGGDVHCGGHSSILKSGEVLFYQLTTSAIANMPLPKSVYYVMRFVEQLEHIQDDYTFSHFNWTRARNYGIIQIKLSREQGDGRPEIITQLFRGKFMRPVRTGKRVSNLEDNATTGCKLKLAICRGNLITLFLKVREASIRGHHKMK